MAKQIILTQNDYGIELEMQLVDDKKRPISTNGYNVKANIIYDNKVIDTIIATCKDEDETISYIILEKEHLKNVGLHTVVWSVVDEDEHITAQEDLYYFVKETKVTSDNNDNEDIIEEDKVTIILNEITEARKDNVTGIKHDTIGKRMDNISQKLNNSQLFKLTKDNGEYNYNIESEKKSVLDLDVGYYGTTTTNFTDLPISTSALIQIEVTKNTNLNNNSWRKKIEIDYSYSRRKFVGYIHNNGDFNGWREVKYSSEIQSHYEQTASALRKKILLRQGFNTKTLGFITDTHYHLDGWGECGHKGLEHINNIVDFCNGGGVDMLIHGGDMVHGTHDEYIRDLSDVNKSLNTCVIPTYSCKGNHDFGLFNVYSSTDKKASRVMHPLYWKKLMHDQRVKRHGFTDNTNSDKYSSYCYYDFDDTKLRVIILNSCDEIYKKNDDETYTLQGFWGHAYRNYQINWLINKALNFSDKASSDWNVAFFMHTPLFDKNNNFNKTINANVVYEIIKAIKNKTILTYSDTSNELADYNTNINVDFSNSKLNIVGVFSGHSHRDYMHKNDNINHVALINGYSDCSTNEERINGTSTEDSWNIITIDTSNKRVYIDKFGYGESFNFTY